MTPEPVTAGAAVQSAIPHLADLLRELRDEKIDPVSDLGEKTIWLWLGAPTGEHCKCGAPMARYERMNGRCRECVHTEALRYADERRERQKFAK